MTEACIRLVKRFEGFSPVPYRCPAGILTVGYGHVVTEKDSFVYPLTEEQAERILIADLMRIERIIRPMILVPLSWNQLDALVSFSFNVGPYAFRISTLRRLLNEEDYEGAGEQFLRWVYAGKTKLKGLVKRRQAERTLFLYAIEERT
jgi:lysozyme